MAIILPASAYPIEIVQAARFVSDTNNIPKVKDQNWDAAIFQELGSSPAAMEAGNSCDFYGLLPGHRADIPEQYQRTIQS